jgi:acyl-CoA thioesterase
LSREGENSEVALGEFFKAAAASGPHASVEIPASWLQGRTSFGGILSALALNAAMQTAPDLPLPRAAQISFAGPAAGKVKFEAELVRRGRSAAFVNVSASTESGPALNGYFIFAGARPSTISFPARPAQTVPPPEDCKPIFGNPSNRPSFMRHLEFRSAGRSAPGEAPEFLAWVRTTKDAGGIDPFLMLLLIGDALPPAATALTSGLGPMSSMNWSVNFLSETPTTRDGWWLLRTTAQQALDGFGSQSMAMSNTDGVVVAQSMQAVAMFV